jgi:hypothetical protein
MLCDFSLGLAYIFITMTTLCSHRKIVSSEVTVPLLLFVQSKLLFQGLRDHLCKFTGVELTENILLTMKGLRDNPPCTP